ATLCSNRRTDDALRFALGVLVRGVDEIDASVLRGTNDARGRRCVGAIAEHHGAKTKRRDLEPAAAEPAVLHGHGALPERATTIPRRLDARRYNGGPTAAALRCTASRQSLSAPPNARLFRGRRP